MLLCSYEEVVLLIFTAHFHSSSHIFDSKCCKLRRCLVLPKPFAAKIFQMEALIFRHQWYHALSNFAQLAELFDSKCCKLRRCLVLQGMWGWRKKPIIVWHSTEWGGAWYFASPLLQEEKSQSLFDLQRCAGVTATVDWSGLIFVRSDRSILRKKSSHAHCCKSISIGGIDISSTMIPCSVKVRTVGGIVDKPRMFLLWCNVEASNNSGGSKSSSSAAIL